MTQEQLRQEVMRFVEANDIPTNIRYLDYFIQCFYDLVAKHHEDVLYTQAEADAKIVLQMMFSKLIHLRKLFEGVTFINKEGTQLINPIIDPTIISSLVRNVYETVCMFNIVYDVPDTKDKKKILYNLWVIAGLNYRQRFSKIIKNPENTLKAEEEKEKIEILTREIKETQLYKDLDAVNKSKIDTKIKKKDYKIKIKDNKVNYLDWQKISDNFISKSDMFGNMYTYFSLYSHPSNVSVFQFADMFSPKDEAFKRIAIFNLRLCLALSSIFLSDFLRLFPSTMPTFENRSDIEQIILNFFNRMFRGDEKSISQMWEKLG